MVQITVRYCSLHIIIFLCIAKWMEDIVKTMKFLDIGVPSTLTPSMSCSDPEEGKREKEREKIQV